VHLRPLSKRLPARRHCAYARNSRPYELFKRRSHLFAEDLSALLSNSYQIVGGTRRIFNFHALRNFKNADSTSDAVATSPRASCPSASSIAQLLGCRVIRATAARLDVARDLNELLLVRFGPARRTLQDVF
jgi:hypothetical protein